MANKIIEYLGIWNYETKRPDWRNVYLWVGILALIKLFIESIPYWEIDMWGIGGYYYHKLVIVFLTFFSGYTYWGYFRLQKYVYNKLSQSTTNKNSK